MNVKRLCLLGALICLCISCSANKSNAPPSYERTIIFETSPGEAPYYFSPECQSSYFIDFELNGTQLPSAANKLRSRAFSYAPSIGYFWALNDGKLAFINRRLKTIFVVEPSTGRYRAYYPVIKPYTDLVNLWVGPNDEFYVLVSSAEMRPDNTATDDSRNRPASSWDYIPYSFTYRLIKYRPLSEGYVLDKDFDMAEHDKRPRFVRISPHNNLYVQGWSDISRALQPAGVFNENGRFIKSTFAHGETCDGQEFYVHPWPRDNLAASFLDWLLCHCTTEVIAWPGDKSILRVKMDHAYRNANFKAACDGRLLLYLHNERRSPLSHGGMLAADFPLVIIKDLGSDKIENIDLSECRREEYDYFSISDVSLNYLGEIYAIAIYFNYRDGRSTDEKIVLYRWRQTNS